MLTFIIGITLIGLSFALHLSEDKLFKRLKRKPKSDTQPIQEQQPIIVKPKNADYFRQKSKRYVEDMTPVWEQQAREMCALIVEEIEEWTNENPEAHEYSICTMSLYHEPHPLQKLDNQAHALCREQLKELGFTIERRVIRSYTSYIISW